MRVYLVMKACSCIYGYTEGWPHLAFNSRKKANACAKDLNSRAKSCKYFVESVKVKEG